MIVHLENAGDLPAYAQASVDRDRSIAGRNLHAVGRDNVTLWLAGGKPLTDASTISSRSSRYESHSAIEQIGAAVSPP